MPIPAISQALTALLPSLPATNKAFPSALVSQCEAFLALSRQRASNLKSEEEIARAHACAEIACKRLRVELRLPAIKHGAGAPCKPSVYKKLIAFLEGVLADVSTGSVTGTPKGRKRDADGSVIRESDGIQVQTPITSSRQRHIVDDTPSKKRTVDKTMPGIEFVGRIENVVKGKGKTTASTANVNGRGGRDDGKDGGDDKAPSFVMPSIRRLCKKFGTPQMVPHVYTGSCVILDLATLWPPEDEDDVLTDEVREDIMFLIVALYLLVLTRMQKGKMTAELFGRVSNESINALDLNEESKVKIDGWINALKVEGWYDNQDWWESVPQDVLVLGGETGDAVHDDDMLDGLEDEMLDGGQVVRPRGVLLEADDPDGVLLPGLGTMLHDRIDWTSEDKRLDYKDWESRILRKLDALDRAEAQKAKATTVTSAKKSSRNTH